MSGRWYGFEHFYSAIDYTACITDAAGVVLKDTCKFVGTDTNATLEGAQLQVFKVSIYFKIIVKYEDNE